MMIQFLKYLPTVLLCVEQQIDSMEGFKLIPQSLTQYLARVSTFLELILMYGPAPGRGNWPDVPR